MGGEGAEALPTFPPQHLQRHLQLLLPLGMYCAMQHCAYHVGTSKRIRKMPKRGQKVLQFGTPCHKCRHKN